MDKNKRVETQAEFTDFPLQNTLTLYEHLIVEVAKSLARRDTRETWFIAEDTVKIVDQIFELTESKQ